MIRTQLAPVSVTVKVQVSVNLFRQVRVIRQVNQLVTAAAHQ
ncbi:hypothetical protein P7D73_19880 [Enterococcus raffinosus]|nr:hypothetical protein [Enterococcus raffinosus]MDT2525463.1 hypothetical protein [Enterococcus raffinosus]MDT2536468.1 hypothetical protein [Enterococcus raffinosus]MDT2592815.1 hypothetical protein [Enterococcus raffinosus]